MTRHLRWLAVFALSVVCGCGADAQTAATPGASGSDRPPALLAALTGPWRPEPLPVTPALVSAVDRACRSDPEFPAPLSLALIDARGARKLMAYYAGPGGAAGCEYGTIAKTGEVSGSLGWSADRPPASPAPGRLDGISGSGSSDACCAWQAVSGQVGAGIDRVVLDVADIGPVTATVRNGWFSAWWPIGPPGRADIPPAKAYVATAYDIIGQPVATVTSPP